MGVKIPKSVLTPPLEGLNLKSRGKVRDTYEILSHPDLLLVNTTNRISIFDFVLPAIVPKKGEVLTALTHFWLTQVLKDFPSHFVAYGQEINQLLGSDFSPEQLTRMMVVKHLKMLPVEAVVRGYLTGSGWTSYQQDQQVCGQRLPAGLHDGSQLPFPIFTPTTKAETGHDEPVTPDWVADVYGFKLERLSLQLYMTAAQFAIQRGIIIADTKFEFGHYNGNGTFLLGDEVLTPDSSRFWLKKDWEKASQQKKSPPGLDKQPVREWGKTIGIDKFDPENPEHLTQVHSLEVPTEVIEQTTRRYRYIFYLLTGKKLEVFQRDYGIEVPIPKVRIDVVIGSQNDLEQVTRTPDYFEKFSWIELHVHILSCHRNPNELMEFAEQYANDGIIIAGAGKAAALPGVLAAWLSYFGKRVPVIGVAFEGKNQRETEAAQLSIEQLPGQPVILDPKGNAYTGPDGFYNAFELAANAEFLPQPIESKPPVRDLDWKK